MKLLKKLYSIKSPSRHEDEMRSFIMKWLTAKQIPYSVDDTGNIYATKGKAKDYPCLVAHIDEVHNKRPEDYTVVQVGNLIFGLSENEAKTVGIGADDKNGIWINLKCLEKYKVLKAAFFVGEEIGCVGSDKADMDFFKDCRYVLECDRRGSSDLITEISGLKLCSDEFAQAAITWMPGFHKTNGMMTDVMTLKENGLEVSAVNISCGYYHPHTDGEMTVISDLEYTLKVVQNIISHLKKVYPHKAEPRTYTGYGYNYYQGTAKNPYYGNSYNSGAYSPTYKSRYSDFFYDDDPYDDIYDADGYPKDLNPNRVVTAIKTEPK